MTSGEQLEVGWIVRDDQAATETNSGRHHQCIDRHLTSPPDAGEQVARDSSDSHSSGYNPHETSSQDQVDRLVQTTATVELEQDSRWNAYPMVAKLSAAQGSSHPKVPRRILGRSRQRRQRFAVEDQDGHWAS